MLTISSIKSFLICIPYGIFTCMVSTAIIFITLPKNAFLFYWSIIKAKMVGINLKIVMFCLGPIFFFFYLIICCFISLLFGLFGGLYLSFR